MKPVQASGRDKLLDAADALFVDAGYSEVGVAAVLEHAGVQAPTLYHHFSDKEGLYVAWAERALSALGHRLKDSGAHDFEGLAKAIWQSLEFDVVQAVRDASRLSRPESREKVVTAYFEAVYEPLVAELVRKISVGEIRPEPVGRVIDGFLGGLFTLKRQNPQDPGAIAEWWAGLFLAGLRTDQAEIAYERP